MGDTGLKKTAEIWEIRNKKRYQSKGLGLINFESRLKSSNTLSDEIKRDINRMLGAARHYP